MKSYIIPGALAFCLIACTSDSVNPTKLEGSLPLREITFNYDGTKTQVTTFEYDNQDRKIREVTESARPEYPYTRETVYNYDSDGHLIKVTKTEGTSSIYTKYEYEKGLLKSVVETYSRSESSHHVDYYYTGNLADSALSYTYSELGLELFSRFTTKYTYDDKQRVIRSGFQILKYDDADRVISSCIDYASDCYETEYNLLGQISKYYLVYADLNQRYLMDEYIYEDGRLSEKKSYSWFYLMEPGPGPDVLVRKYEY